MDRGEHDVVSHCSSDTEQEMGRYCLQREIQFIPYCYNVS